MQCIMSMIGMIVLIFIAIIFSNHRRSIKLRTVLGAFLIQIIIGAFVLYIPSGRNILIILSDVVYSVIAYGQIGIDFIFGALVSDKMVDLFGSSGFIFSLRILPIIVFFSSLISVCYYLGIIQLFIKIVGGFFQWVLGISRTESLSATANIFIGHTEAPLVIKPYISTMTNSELFAVMCGGLSSVAGSVLAGYSQMGIPMEYLIAASFMSAPGGILFAKLIVPETEKICNEINMIYVNNNKEESPINIIDAAASGASTGIQLALNVGGMLLAFVALIALLNGILSVIGNWMNITNFSLELILGYIFSPIAYLIGIPWNEAKIVGSFIGQKLVMNEFIAYMNFSEYLKSDNDLILTGKQVLSENTKAIISFALCGFSNFSSVAILLGCLGGIAPSRRKDVAQLSLKTILASSLSNLMSATIAGFFLSLGAKL
ncbi:NupC/NupG family nucleoside CNT transporter [Arsenophonus symbiont of Ornithomya chloropus]|uniref:NupC/NupG family nucleoside CNT transporter n=1 Tax=Arsenophonus symbiont of Ornithomya chloropus TaxID=634121 RepID=UPI0032B23838